MFVEMGQTDDARMSAMVANVVPWGRERLRVATYVGWLRKRIGM